MALQPSAFSLNFFSSHFLFAFSTFCFFHFLFSSLFASFHFLLFLLFALYTFCFFPLFALFFTFCILPFCLLYFQMSLLFVFFTFCFLCCSFSSRFVFTPQNTLYPKPPFTKVEMRSLAMETLVIETFSLKPSPPEVGSAILRMVFSA